jgi:hypothetical protein
MSDPAPASNTAAADQTATNAGAAGGAAAGGQAAGAGTGAGAAAAAAGAGDAAKAAATAAAGAAEAAKTAAAATEAAKTAADAPKRLLSFADEAKKDDAAAVSAKAAADAAAKPEDWKLERAKDSQITQVEFDAMAAKAKALNLSKDQANALLQERSTYQAAENRRVNDQWHAEAMADAEIGGAKMPATVANAQKVLTAYATPAERKAIADSPFANNPFFLRFCNRIAAAMPAEDTVHTGDKPAGGKQYPRNPAEAARAMYNK